MKKSRIVGYALALAATLFVGSAMGQATTATNDNIFSITKYKTSTEEAIEYVTKGTTTSYYATPDAAYHPGWDNTAKTWTLLSGATWTWSTVPATLPANMTKPKSANYVEIKWVNSGDHVLSVFETLPTGFNCTTSAPVDKTVKVLDPPTVKITTTYPAGFTAFQFCSTDAIATRTPSFSISIDEGAAPASLDNYLLGYSIKKDEVSNTGAVTAGTATNHTPLEVIAAKTGSVVLPELKLTTGSSRTKFTIKLYYLSSSVTRKGDFATNYAYDGTATDLLAKTWTNFFATDAARPDELVYFVNAAPVTGPVYHISNSFAK